MAGISEIQIFSSLGGENHDSKRLQVQAVADSDNGSGGTRLTWVDVNNDGQVTPYVDEYVDNIPLGSRNISESQKMLKKVDYGFWRKYRDDLEGAVVLGYQKLEELNYYLNNLGDFPLSGFDRFEDCDLDGKKYSYAEATDGNVAFIRLLINSLDLPYPAPERHVKGLEIYYSKLSGEFFVGLSSYQLHPEKNCEASDGQTFSFGMSMNTPDRILMEGIEKYLHRQADYLREQDKKELIKKYGCGG